LERVHGVERASRARRQRGQGTVEYGLLIGAGALVVVVAMLFLAESLDHLFGKTGSQTNVFRPPVVVCEASYEGVCIPPSPPDLECADLEAMGIPLPVTVVGDDPHGLDPDGDGLGCSGGST
jgi:Flp pilus assembly pilin Flp